MRNISMKTGKDRASPGFSNDAVRISPHLLLVAQALSIPAWLYRVDETLLACSELVRKVWQSESLKEIITIYTCFSRFAT